MASESAAWRYVPGVAWCMAEGAVVDMLNKRHVTTDWSRCPAEHRKVAANVTAQEYPDFRAVSQ